MGYQTQLPEQQTMKWTSGLSVTVTTHILLPGCLPLQPQGLLAGSGVLSSRLLKKSGRPEPRREKGSHYNVFFRPSAYTPNRSVSKNHRAVPSVTFLNHHSEFSFQDTNDAVVMGRGRIQDGEKKETKCDQQKGNSSIYAFGILTTIEATF